MEEIKEKNPQLRFDLGHENVDTKGFTVKDFKAKKD